MSKSNILDLAKLTTGKQTDRRKAENLALKEAKTDGRKRLSRNRNVSMSFKFTAEERAMIEQLADNLGHVSFTDAIIQAVQRALKKNN